MKAMAPSARPVRAMRRVNRPRAKVHAWGETGLAVPSPPHLIEIPQIGRRLVLARRHQLAVGAFEIDLVADLGQQRDSGTVLLAPDRIFVGAAAIAFQR